MRELHVLRPATYFEILTTTERETCLLSVFTCFHTCNYSSNNRCSFRNKLSNRILLSIQSVDSNSCADNLTPLLKQFFLPLKKFSEQLSSYCTTHWDTLDFGRFFATFTTWQKKWNRKEGWADIHIWTINAGPLHLLAFLMSNYITDGEDSSSSQHYCKFPK